MFSRKKIILLYSLFLLIFVSIFKIISTENKIDEKKLEMMIGQMLMVSFRGYDVTENDFIVKDIKERNLGGIIIFDYDVVLKSKDRNIHSPEQLKSLLKKLNSYTETPLFIAIDQEGGRVCRLKPSNGFPETMSAKSLGEKNDLSFTRGEAVKIGAMLSELGININFAPVVDLDINPDNPAIGRFERSFSKDPDIVTNNANAFINGLAQGRIFACLKHFPGHGSSSKDSHNGIVDVSKTWVEDELIPYQKLIERNLVSIIMTAHIFNKNLDPCYPATLSKKILTDLLRNKLHYEGVIISDDMQMKAISKNYGLKNSIYRAIYSGIDILLFCNNLSYDESITQKVIKIVKSLVKNNKISYERIEESYNRIMELKSKL